MNQKEIKELIELLVEKDIAEFELERGDMKLHIKRGATAQFAPVVQVAPAVASVPATPAVPAAASSPAPGQTPAAAGGAQAPTAPPVDADLHIVKSPIVGTFYESPSPGAPPFLKIGDTVQEGQVLCIIEAMKLMNEIEAEFRCKIIKICKENAQPVEFGDPLFLVERL